MNSNQPSMFTTGARIRKYRLAQNLTQEELAAKAGIIAKYMSLIENDQREASIHVYRCIADALEVPTWYLFCNESEETLLILAHFNDCTEMEIRALGRFIVANKEALRQNHKLDLGL